MDILDQKAVAEVDPNEQNDTATSRDPEQNCSEVELLTPQSLGIRVDEFECTSPASPTSYYNALSDGGYSSSSDEMEECGSVLSDSDFDFDVASAVKEAEILSPYEENEEEEEEDSDYDPERLQIQQEYEAMVREMARAPKLPSPVVIPEDWWSIPDVRHAVHDPMGLFRKDERLEYLEHRHRELSSDMRTRARSPERIDDKEDHVTQTSRTGKEVQHREEDDNSETVHEEDEGGGEEIDDGEKSEWKIVDHETTVMAPTISSKVQQRELEAIEEDKATIKKRQSLKYILKGWISKLSHLCPHKKKRRRRRVGKRMPHDIQQQSSAASAT